MPIDSSIYANVQPPPQVALQSPLDIAQKAMTLGQLGIQQMQMARQMRAQSAIQDAYMKNTDPNTGQVDQDGAVAQLGKQGDFQAQQALSSQFATQNKATAEAKAAQVDFAEKSNNITGPTYEYLNKVPEDQRASVWPTLVQNMKAQGVDTSRMNPQYDPDDFKQHLDTWRNSPINIANQETLAKTQQSLAAAAKDRSETPTGITGPVSASTDPATLVPQMMPKDMRPKALEEIKNAQDLRALSPKIMAAFDMGTSKNPITAAQGQKQFAGLMNTTVKETEGTVRQAAMDSIQDNMAPKGITALPGANDSRRATVLAYLQSKQSAPVSKSYGIDLSKFASTAPFQPPAKNADANGGGSTAQAADAPDYIGALNYLKTADPTSPQAFKVRSILKAKGLIQ